MLLNSLKLDADFETLECSFAAALLSKMPVSMSTNATLSGVPQHTIHMSVLLVMKKAAPQSSVLGKLTILLSAVRHFFYYKCTDRSPVRILMDTNAILTGSSRQHNMAQSQCNDVADRYILQCVYYQIVIQYAETVSFT